MAQVNLTLTVDTRAAQAALAVLKPLCWLRIMPTSWAASIAVRFIRIKTS